MASRQDLLVCLSSLIDGAAKTGETQLALGRKVVVPLSGVLVKARPTRPELQALLDELPHAVLADRQLTAEVTWEGPKDDGEQVITLTKA